LWGLCGRGLIRLRRLLWGISLLWGLCGRGLIRLRRLLWGISLLWGLCGSRLAVNRQAAEIYRIQEIATEFRFRIDRIRAIVQTRTIL
jgi:hypothetical protein